MSAVPTRSRPLGWLHPASRIARLSPGAAAWAPAFVAALLSCLLVLALAVAAGTERVRHVWADLLAETATLSIIAEEAEIEAQARAALDILRDAPGVRAIRVIDPAEQRGLLAPWLGTEIAIEDSLPLMIEVSTDRAQFDAPELGALLREEVPGAIIDDHSAWILPHVAAAERVVALAALGAALALAALAGTAALAGGAAVAQVRASLDNLRLLGMPDALLARAALARTVRAMLAGVGLGVATGTGLALLASGELGSSAGVGFHGLGWLLPPAAAFMAGTLVLGAGLISARRAVGQLP